MTCVVDRVMRYPNTNAPDRLLHDICQDEALVDSSLCAVVWIAVQILSISVSEGLIPVESRDKFVQDDFINTAFPSKKG